MVLTRRDDAHTPSPHVESSWLVECCCSRVELSGSIVRDQVRDGASNGVSDNKDKRSLKRKERGLGIATSGRHAHEIRSRSTRENSRLTRKVREKKLCSESMSSQYWHLPFMSQSTTRVPCFADLLEH